jgi:hypothetical protein
VSINGGRNHWVSGQPIEPRDVAAGTAIGAAVRVGAARYRDRIRGQRTGEGAAAGAGAATALVERGRAKRRKGSLLLGTLAFLIIVIGMLALMLAVGR